MKTLHQLHNEEQAEAFRRDSVDFKLWSRELDEMDLTTRRLQMLSVVLKILVVALSVGLVVYLWLTNHLTT